MKDIREKKARFIVLLVSLALSAVVAVVFTAKFSFMPAAVVGVVAVICVPAVWQFFLMPVYMSAKHYFLSAALYLTFWGAPVSIAWVTISKNYPPAPISYSFLAVVFITWFLGAFLKK